MQELIKDLLIKMGENPEREGLQRTPLRVEKSFEFLTSGYRDNIDEKVDTGLFTSEDNEMIVVRDIEFYSMCEHHILPFYGRCHIAYIPDKTILGLSKFARITDHFSRRLQLQERLTSQIADYIQEKLNPLGVAVVMDAMHLCMMMRGVQKQNSKTTSSALRGVFKSNSKTRNEFLSLIKII